MAAAAAGEEARVFGRSVRPVPSVPSSVPEDRPWWLALLLRGPKIYSSPLVRAAITLVIAVGGVCVIGSGVIHLYLWGKQFGYRSIPTIGPLFLIQGISCILIGLLTIITRRLVMVLVSAGTMVASFCALIIAVEWGLFGWQDSWSAAYALTALYVEIAGAVVLLAAAIALAWSARAGLARPGHQATHRYTANT